VPTILNLLLAGASVLGARTWQAVLPSVIVSAVVLIYYLTPRGKEAFGHLQQHV
jgi:hypothetical protein